MAEAKLALLAGRARALGARCGATGRGEGSLIEVTEDVLFAGLSSSSSSCARAELVLLWPLGDCLHVVAVEGDVVEGLVQEEIGAECWRGTCRGLGNTAQT